MESWTSYSIENKVLCIGKFYKCSMCHTKVRGNRINPKEFLKREK